MPKGETFGEITFLLSDRSPSYSIIAGEDTEICIIEGDNKMHFNLAVSGYFIGILFGMREGFAGRFFKYLAAVLARRVFSKERLVFNYWGWSDQILGAREFIKLLHHLLQTRENNPDKCLDMTDKCQLMYMFVFQLAMFLAASFLWNIPSYFWIPGSGWRIQTNSGCAWVWPQILVQE